MPETPVPPPLAQQPRTFRWWLRTARRSPLLLAMLVVQFLGVPVLWSFWEPSWWLKDVVNFLGMAVLVSMVRAIIEKHGQAVENGSEALEAGGEAVEAGAGGRRPLDAPSSEEH